MLLCILGFVKLRKQISILDSVLVKGFVSYVIYGYCLMDNHIHLVIKETEESLSCIMKRIG